MFGRFPFGVNPFAIISSDLRARIVPQEVAHWYYCKNNKPSYFVLDTRPHYFDKGVRPMFYLRQE